MKTRALKIVVAAMLVMSMIMTAVGAATITKTKFNSGTGLITVEYYVSGEEAVLTAYDPLDESNVVYFYQQPGSGTGKFQFTVPEGYTSETVAVRVGGTNEASATAFVSVTPTPAPTPDPESVEMGGIYNYIAKEPFAEDTVVIDKENQRINMDSDFDIEVNNLVWEGLAKSDDCFNFGSGYMYVDPLRNISRELITIKFAPITEGTTKISFDATMIANGKSWDNPSYFGAVVDTATYSESTVGGKNQITGLVTGMARVQEFNGHTILDNTATKGIVRFDDTMNGSGKYTEYDVVVNDNMTHNYEYVINMDAKTYTLTIDGALIGTYDFYDTSVNRIDAIKFHGSAYADSAHQNARYSVDNIVVKTTQEIETNNIKFYNEAGTKLVKELNAHENKQIVAPTAPTKRGCTFVGWSLTPGGTDLVSFDEVTADMIVYASYVAKPIITYMDGETVYNTETVDYNETIEAPVLADKGEYEFIGWYLADGSAANFSNIKADMTVYAKFGKPIVKAEEDFDTTGFAIDTTTATITTNSDFNFSAETNAFKFLKVKDGGLYMGARGQASANNYDNSVYASFEPITSGKLYVSFDLKTDDIAFQNWIAVFDGPFFTIGNSDNSKNAVSLYMRGFDTSNQTNKTYLATKKGSSGATNDVIGLLEKNADYIRIDYIIDMDAGTYSVAVDGVMTSNIPFTDYDMTEISRIKLPLPSNGTAQYAYSNWQIDNLSARSYRELGEAKPTYEVIFYDEDGITELYRTEVEEGQTAVYGGETPTKTATAQYTYTFKGWDKELTNITEPTIVKATYNSIINKYTVTFVDYDGRTLGTSTVDYGTAATAPENPTRESDGEYEYTFKSWDKAFDNVTENITVTAQYDRTLIEVEPEFVIIPCFGDFNGDNQITATDIEYLQSKIKGMARTTLSGYTIGELISGTTIILGDFNGDNQITATDIEYLQSKIKGMARTTPSGYKIGAEAKIPKTQ